MGDVVDVAGADVAVGLERAPGGALPDDVWFRKRLGPRHAAASSR